MKRIVFGMLSVLLLLGAVQPAHGGVATPSWQTNELYVIADGATIDTVIAVSNVCANQVSGSAKFSLQNGSSPADKLFTIPPFGTVYLKASDWWRILNLAPATIIDGSVTVTIGNNGVTAQTPQGSNCLVSSTDAQAGQVTPIRSESAVGLCATGCREFAGQYKVDAANPTAFITDLVWSHEPVYLSADVIRLTLYDDQGNVAYDQNLPLGNITPMDGIFRLNTVQGLTGKHGLFRMKLPSPGFVRAIYWRTNAPKTRDVVASWCYLLDNCGVVAGDGSSCRQTRPNPSCGNFTANPSSIQSGQSSTLSWNNMDGDTGTMNPDGSAIALPNGTKTVSPAATTTYTINLKRTGKPDANCPVTVTVTSVPPPPQNPKCLSFTADRTTISHSGDPVVLTWQSQNGSTAQITPGVGSVTPVSSGSVTVHPTANTSYTYTVSAPNLPNNSCPAVTVRLECPPPPPTPRCTLTLNPSTINKGQNSSLSWTAQGYDHYTTSPSVSGWSGPSGSTSVSPTASTTYAMTLYDAGNHQVASCSARLTVNCPPPDDGNEGCSPGYWKQSQHFDSYVTYSPNDNFNSVFGRNAVGSTTTLSQALWLTGGGVNPLVRQAVAALLNATSVNYHYTANQVIQMFQHDYDSHDWSGDDLGYYNDDHGATCPLD